MTAPQIRTVPANECGWADLQVVLADEGNSCQCQFFKLDDVPRVVRADEQIAGGAAYLYVGTQELFASTGYHEVGRPTGRRAVMRIDF